VVRSEACPFGANERDFNRNPQIAFRVIELLLDEKRPGK
jgi:hypothetical protein